jgi:hypothetical protein
MGGAPLVGGKGTKAEGLRMAMLKIKDLRTITVKILPNGKGVQLHFETVDARPYESIEVELASIMALGLANETLKLLSPRNVLSPPKLDPLGGRPKIRIAKPAAGAILGREHRPKHRGIRP